MKSMTEETTLLDLDKLEKKWRKKFTLQLSSLKPRRSTALHCTALHCTLHTALLWFQTHFSSIQVMDWRHIFCSGLMYFFSFFFFFFLLLLLLFLHCHLISSMLLYSFRPIFIPPVLLLFLITKFIPWVAYSTKFDQLLKESQKKPWYRYCNLSVKSGLKTFCNLTHSWI